MRTAATSTAQSPPMTHSDRLPTPLAAVIASSAARTSTPSSSEVSSPSQYTATAPEAASIVTATCLHPPEPLLLLGAQGSARASSVARALSAAPGRQRAFAAQARAAGRSLRAAATEPSAASCTISTTGTPPARPRRSEPVRRRPLAAGCSKGAPGTCRLLRSSFEKATPLASAAPAAATAEAGAAPASASVATVAAAPAAAVTATAAGDSCPLPACSAASPAARSASAAVLMSSDTSISLRRRVASRSAVRLTEPSASAAASAAGLAASGTSA
mmetsp:Transcript_25698/g.96771  ORF Transcript_25698/g.96771 Transcript_25698/m.96771 type:complete len:274 (-) Transcript_25698:74-895(-)